jgi:hypothetical protein
MLVADSENMRSQFPNLPLVKLVKSKETQCWKSSTHTHTAHVKNYISLKNVINTREMFLCNKFVPTHFSQVTKHHNSGKSQDNDIFMFADVYADS